MYNLHIIITVVKRHSGPTCNIIVYYQELRLLILTVKTKKIVQLESVTCQHYDTYSTAALT